MGTTHGIKPKHCKLRGEVAELRFMARAADNGLRIIKPWGDNSRYDFVVEQGGKFLRVQVKATSSKLGNAYACHLSRGPQKRYTKADIDFIAAYIIPRDIWYIVPVEVTGMSTVVLSPDMENSKHARYKEAWHLLRGEGTQAGEETV